MTSGRGAATPYLLKNVTMEGNFRQIAPMSSVTFSLNVGHCTEWGSIHLFNPRTQILYHGGRVKAHAHVNGQRGYSKYVVGYSSRELNCPIYVEADEWASRLIIKH